MSQIQNPYQQFFDTDGNPLDNGKVYIGIAGQNPISNPLQVFWDVDLTIPVAQPILTSNGYLVRNGTISRVYYNDNINYDFSILVRNNKNEIIYSELQVLGIPSGIASDTGSNIIGFIQAGTNAVATTVQEKLRRLIDVEDFATLADAIVYAKANNKIVRLSNNTTINIPSDALNLQDAFDYTSTAHNQVLVNVELTAGYVISDVLLLTNGNYSNYTITKTSGTFTVNSGLSGDIMRFDNCIAPTIDIFINAAGAPAILRGISYTNKSQGVILPNAGVSNVVTTTPQNSDGNGLFLENCSKVNASNSIFTGCNLRNVHVTTGSVCELSGANVSAGVGTDNVWVSRGSICILDGANISNGLGNGVTVLRSRVSMVPFSGSDLNCSGNALNNINVNDTGVIFAGSRGGTRVNISNAGQSGLNIGGTGIADIERALITNCGGYGIIANEASTVNAQEATITGCTRAVLSTNGSTVELEGADCTLAVVRGLEARRSARIGATFVLARRNLASDGTDDVVISAGGLINFNSGVGGVNTTVNTLTGAGIIFR